MRALEHTQAEAGDRGPLGAEPLTLATHPRASRHIRWAKGWGGLVAFAVVAWLSWRAGMSAFDAGARALAAGIVGFLAAWAASLYVCRVLVEAEHKLAAERERHAEGAEPDTATGPAEA